MNNYRTFRINAIHLYKSIRSFGFYLSAVRTNIQTTLSTAIYTLGYRMVKALKHLKSNL